MTREWDDDRTAEIELTPEQLEDAGGGVAPLLFIGGAILSMGVQRVATHLAVTGAQAALAYGVATFGPSATLGAYGVVQGVGNSLSGQVSAPSAVPDLVADVLTSQAVLGVDTGTGPALTDALINGGSAVVNALTAGAGQAPNSTWGAEGYPGGPTYDAMGNVTSPGAPAPALNTIR